jgi:hypothetical protein
MQEITAVVPTTGAKVTIEVDFGSNLAELVSLYGEDVIYSAAKSDLVVSAQGRSRALLKKGQTPEEVATTMKTWKPGVKVVGTRAVSSDAMLKKAEKMSQTELAEYIAKLQARAAELGG